jgi:hypothetical protein
MKKTSKPARAPKHNDAPEIKPPVIPSPPEPTLPAAPLVIVSDEDVFHVDGMKRVVCHWETSDGIKQLVRNDNGVVVESSVA